MDRSLLISWAEIAAALSSSTHEAWCCRFTAGLRLFGVVSPPAAAVAAVAVATAAAAWMGVSHW